MNHRATLSIPESLAREAAGVVAADPEARMRQVVAWSRDNVSRGEGPFAAGVFHLETGACIAAGVNRVLSSGCSVAHAEMMALMLAQVNTGRVNLSDVGPLVLTSSAQPCSQCFGGIPWSGVVALEYGAAREDVEAIGFDEGPCPGNWRDLLEKRGIRVLGPLLRGEAAAVLQRYADQSGEIY